MKFIRIECVKIRVLLLIAFCQIAIIQCEEIRIAFGSCFYSGNPVTTIFQRIVEFKPDVFVWIGDAAYLDRMTSGGFKPNTNQTSVEQLFNITKNHPDYKILRKQIRIEGIWDDHDYNQNNGDEFNPTKHNIRQDYLDFLDVDSNSPRRTNEDGIFYSFVMGNQTKVKIILLDGRWNREPQNITNPTEVLGEPQWTWLEEQMRSSTEDLILLTSGTQVIPDDRPFFVETWYEASRQRLYSLIKSVGKKVIILSGDVHYAEFIEHPCGIELSNQKIFEVTSSGISYNWFFTQTFVFFELYGYFLLPDTYSSYQDRFMNTNFGSLTINEQNIRVEIINSQGDIVISKLIPLSSLEHKAQEQSIQCFNHLNSSKTQKQMKNMIQKLAKLVTLSIFWRFGLFISIIVIIVLYRGRKNIKQKKE